MKKLMIAAAAAAMVGGVFADDVTIKYNQVGTNEALQVCQVLQYKIKASTSKSINLDGDKKFGKPTKYTELAVDGVYYYVGNGKWYNFEWNKEEVLVDNKEASAPAFNIFENDDGTKALATYGWVSEFDEYDDKGNIKARHAETWDSYGALKYVTEKDEAGKKVKKLDRTVKSLKSVSGYKKYTIKTFKATTKKTVEEQIAAYIKKITKKAPAKK